MALSEGIKRGTVELLILTILQDQDMYGYQLSQELAARDYTHSRKVLCTLPSID